VSTTRVSLCSAALYDEPMSCVWVIRFTEVVFCAPFRPFLAVALISIKKTRPSLTLAPANRCCLVCRGGVLTATIRPTSCHIHRRCLEMPPDEVFAFHCRSNISTACFIFKASPVTKGRSNGTLWLRADVGVGPGDEG